MRVAFPSKGKKDPNESSPCTERAPECHFPAAWLSRVSQGLNARDQGLLLPLLTAAPKSGTLCRGTEIITHTSST